MLNWLTQWISWSYSPGSDCIPEKKTHCHCEAQSAEAIPLILFELRVTCPACPDMPLLTETTADKVRCHTREGGYPVLIFRVILPYKICLIR